MAFVGKTRQRRWQSHRMRGFFGEHGAGVWRVWVLQEERHLKWNGGTDHWKRFLGHYLRLSAPQAAGPTQNHSSTDRGRPFQKARRKSPEDNHFLRTSGNGEDPLRESDSGSSVLVVHRDSSQHAHGGRHGKNRGQSAQDYGEGQTTPGRRCLHRWIWRTGALPR